MNLERESVRRERREEKGGEGRGSVPVEEWSRSEPDLKLRRSTI